MRDILVIGLVIAVVIILIRIIFGTPLIQRIRETFANANANAKSVALINSSTECPPGSTMYMFEGTALCCSGKFNPDATSIADSCIRTGGRNTESTFCTLGPSVQGAPNCLETRAGLMQAKGESVCPANAPTFVSPAGSAGRCCVTGNAARTDCAVPSPLNCELTKNANIYENANSCQFRRAVQDNVCPAKFVTFSLPGRDSKTHLIGCTDQSRNCYTDSTLKRLKELGYNVAGLTSCSDLNGVRIP